MKKTTYQQFLKAIQSEADELYMHFVKKMKVLDKQAHTMLEEVEKKKVVALRSKIKKIS